MDPLTRKEMKDSLFGFQLKDRKADNSTGGDNFDVDEALPKPDYENGNESGDDDLSPNSK